MLFWPLVSECDLRNKRPSSPTEGSVLYVLVLKYILLTSVLPENVNICFSSINLQELGPNRYLATHR